jgi:hypothetical protein
MRILRGALELLGVGAFLALHYLVILIYMIGSSLRGIPQMGYWLAIVLGYIGMAVVVAFRRRVFTTSSKRCLLDTWLAAFPFAVGLSWALVMFSWPLSFTGWDAHGMGAKGGEANSLFLPWLHLAVWILVSRACRLTR